MTPVRAEEPEILIPAMGYNSWSEVPDRPPPGAKMFVEIFAGEAGITSALRKLGVPCLPPVDLVVAAGCKESVDVYLIQEKIMTWIREGAILAVHFGTPCTTYSAARQKDGGPRPLRTAEHLKGVPGPHRHGPAEHNHRHRPNEAHSRTVSAVPAVQGPVDDRTRQAA